MDAVVGNHSFQSEIYLDWKIMFQNCLFLSIYYGQYVQVRTSLQQMPSMS